MANRSRSILIGVGVLVAVVVLAILAVPMFLNADTLRTRIETTLSASLGRKVTVGKLDISVLSGGLVAHDAAVADDPAFSTQPFLQAASVKIGVELIPLILRREVHVKSFDLESPRISLLRGANGVWNYSSIGSGSKHNAANDQQTSSMIPNLTVAEVDVHNGQLTVGDGPGVVGASASPLRTYDQFDLSVTDFSFSKSFPFTASAHLPADGQVSLKGAAGPINQQDASLTPFTAHLDVKHLDPLAAGFVDQTSGLSGLVDSIAVDAAWSGQQLHVTKLAVGSPHLTIVRSNKPTTTPAKLPDPNSMWSTMSIDQLSLSNGAVTVTTPGAPGPPAVYSAMNASLTNFSPKSSSPFNASAQLPGGGSFQANGTLGPLDAENSAATPLNAQVTLRHIDLAASGLAPASDLAGLANVDAKIASNGQTLNAAGTAHVDGVRLAKNGTPSAKPVDLRFTIAQNMQALTGTIQQAALTVGRAAIDASGTYQTSGPTTAVNLKVAGNAMPIDELEAFLPSLGVRLPTGSRLQGGTLTANLAVTGSTSAPVINGPVRIDNTQLAGFDLGSKLSAVTALTGAKTGSVTSIRSLSMDLHSAGGALRTDNLNLVVPALGTATGNGTVGAGGALDYHVVLKLAALGGGAAGKTAAPAAGGGGIAGQLMGMIPGGSAGGGSPLGAISSLTGGALKGGIPVAIGGTTTNPTFAPNMQGLLRAGGTQAAKSLLGGAGKSAGTGQKSSDPLGNALGGLLGRH